MRLPPDTKKDHTEVTHDTSKCIVCLNRHEFELPKHLLEQLVRGNVVIFAGAGVSTESREVFPWTLYEEVSKDLALGEEVRPTFAGLMSILCDQPDGRRRLLDKIRARFDYVRSFPELYRTATRFHRTLSTLFYVDTYITTNWDDYFERHCGATPFICEEDLAFWDVKGRKVVKLHGSISNLGSVIATQEDYNLTRRRLERGSLGGALKLMLATKTIVYVGYSFNDHDFTAIRRYITKQLKGVAPAGYVVTIDRTAESSFRSLGLTPILTDATHFVEVLKQHIETDGHFLSDDRLDDVHLALAKAQAEHTRLHERFRPQKVPEIVFCSSYQDGLMHALERIVARAHTGRYSHRCDVAAQVRQYGMIAEAHRRRHSYYDEAYATGYMVGMAYLIAPDEIRGSLPYYYLNSRTLSTSLGKYMKARLIDPPTKRAMAAAKRVVSQLGTNDDAHHAPFLDTQTFDPS